MATMLAVAIVAKTTSPRTARMNGVERKQEVLRYGFSAVGDCGDSGGNGRLINGGIMMLPLRQSRVVAKSGRRVEE